MKHSHKMRLKRSVSAVLAASMAMSVFSTVPVYAETGTTTYNYDGYKVDYTVTNEWFGNQSVNVTLTNTGDEPILNWALGYDANGEINGIWNGYVYSQTDEDYIIKNSGYNYEIEPYQSVNFGYTLSGNELEAPEKFELCSKRVDKKEGYDVKLNVTGDWGDGFQGELVVTNTSDYPLEAWKVDFDSNFEINNLWNGKIIDSDDDSYSIASCMWTNPIASGASTVIGFTAGKENSEAPAVSNVKLSEVIIDRNSSEAPEEPVIPSEDILEISADAQYIESDGTAVISWATNVDNGTFEVLYSQDNIEYTQAASISGERSYTYSLGETYGTVYFKVRQTTEGGQTAETSVVSVDIPVPVVPEKPVVTVSAEFDAETDYVNVSWETTAEGGSFDIYVSVDSGEFTKLASVTDAVSYSFAPEVSGSYDIKVVQTTASEMTGESNVVNVICTVADPDEPTEEIDWEDSTDTDNDGLTDVYEKHYFETDPENADTDDDGLPDGYEVYYLGTDPKKADSDDNGVSDGEEDFDSDSLNNLREYELGTDPNNADSDADGLNDSDEISKYSTDPLKYDSDEDGISDGDEITLGLDPNNGNTNGTPDSERTFVQHIGVDSENLAAVNTEENPFKVSIDITAAGVAGNNLSARESGYSNAIKNDAILGNSTEFLYTEGLKVEDVVINFDIDSSAVANTNGKYTSLSDEFVGIKRLNVFKYFEDTNMLLPIETFHDVESGRVYTHVDELGTYCLMDMEVWLDTLGFDVNVSETISVASVTALDAKSNNADEEVNTKINDEIDVVFLMYVDPSYTSMVKDELITTVKNIYDKADDVHIYFLTSTGGSVFDCVEVYMINGKEYAENCNEATSRISTFNFTATSAKALIYGFRKVNDLSLRANSQKHLFIIDDLMYPATATSYDELDYLRKNGFNVGIICDTVNNNISKYRELAEGNVCNKAIVFSDFVINQIDFPTVSNKPNIITSTGLVKLPDDFEEVNLYSDADYDGDTLLDAEEIMFFLLDFNDEGKVISYPNFYDMKKQYDDLLYVEKGMERLENDKSINIQKFLSGISILPIRSDPISPDGDNDGFEDKYEWDNNMSSLSHDAAIIEDTIIDDSNRFDGEYSISKLASSNKYCDGEIKPLIIDEEDPNKTSRASLVFSRKSSSDAEFIIVPERNSDYIFSNSKNYLVSVSRICMFGIEEFIEPIEDGVYALKGGEKYSIYVISDKHSDEEYELTITQDNWVYAPDGGYYTSNILTDNINDTAYQNNCYVKLYLNSEMYDSLKKIMAAHTTDVANSNSYATKIGVVSAFVGLPALYVSPHIGFFLVIEGIIIAIESEVDAENEKRLQNTFNKVVYIDNSYGMVFEREIYETGHTVYNQYYQWNSPNYINKYHNSVRGTVKKGVSEGDIKWFI